MLLQGTIANVVQMYYMFLEQTHMALQSQLEHAKKIASLSRLLNIITQIFAIVLTNYSFLMIITL